MEEVLYDVYESYRKVMGEELSKTKEKQKQMAEQMQQQTEKSQWWKRVGCGQARHSIVSAMHNTLQRLLTDRSCSQTEKHPHCLLTLDQNVT